jgi:glycosyltransferase involved in cell wall biosynthesis
MQVIYFVDNKLGGITSLNYNLVNNAPPDAGGQMVIHIDCKEWVSARANIEFNADKEISFTYSERQGLYQTIRQLHDLLPGGPGALVLNDCLEMQMLDHYPTPRTVYQLVHDEYNFKLAADYHQVVDVFIAHSLFFYEKLLNLFPHRSDTIFYLPHGVVVPAVTRKPQPAENPIRLLFLGRMTASKGIFDLPVIDGLLDEWGVARTWTCIGRGPELEELKSRWGTGAPVEFAAPAGNDEVVRICAANDVFVLPTRFEGSPVSLLETMSVGLVPVISDLPGGIREIVTEDIGLRPAMEDNQAFAAAIKKLAGNRNWLDELSINCRKKVEQQFDVRQTAASYHDLFGKYERFYTKKQLLHKKIGTRLDQAWLPSSFTRLIRKLRS